MLRNFKTRWDWHVAMKAAIEDVLSNCYPRNWDEDHITRSLIGTLRDQFSHTSLDNDKRWAEGVQVAWDMYKNTGKRKMEQYHGDIGVLVKIQFTKDCSLEGVAFVEAKRMYHEKLTYDALEWSQLARLSANSSNHRTLLYDYDVSAQPSPALALTLPTVHLMALNDDTREINKHCEDFSYCLVNRYFQGYELDYNQRRVDAVKGLLAEQYDGVDYLLVSHLTLSPELEPSLETVEFNRQRFQSFETPALIAEDKPSNTPDDFNTPSM